MRISSRVTGEFYRKTKECWYYTGDNVPTERDALYICMKMKEITLSNIYLCQISIICIPQSFHIM